MGAFAPPRGMRDFYPEDYRVRENLFNSWINAAKKYGFELYDAPVVETMDLLERKSGEEISEQIYSFTDKSNRRLALRPELTPSLARMVISRQKAMQFPLKWAAIAQCFRYERMTKGRKREHYQLNLDIVGESSLMAEVEVVATAISALESLGLNSNEIKIKIGSRTLLSELLSRTELSQTQLMSCYLMLDKRGKISDDEIIEYLKEKGISESAINEVFRAISISSINQAAEILGEDANSIKELREFFEIAKSYNLEHYLEFDISVIRGLGYYTGIVFEAFDKEEKFRAVFGGGRYDNLLSSLGGDSVPCVGLGFGDVVIEELLRSLNKLPSSKRSLDYSIGFMDDTCKDFAIKIANKFREKGKSCDISLKKEKAKAFFKKADRNNAEKAIFIGQDEVKNGEIKLKSMKDGTTETKKVSDLE